MGEGTDSLTLARLNGIPHIRPAIIFAALVTLPIGAEGDLSAQEPDTTLRPAEQTPTEVQEPDTAPVPVFPEFPFRASRVAGGVAAAWEVSDLLATGALAVADLVEYQPGLTPVRAGFLEGPQLALFDGRGPVSLRYEVDGYEIAPLLGGALDLQALSPVDLEALRLVREPGGFRLSGRSYRNERPEAYSRVEAGTGDRDTNLLRAFFASRLRGARVGFGFDRYDTDGALPGRAAERNAIWANLAHPLFAGVWGQVEWRNSSADREAYPSTTRNDWILRLRRASESGWFVDLVAGRSSLELQPGSGEAVGLEREDTVTESASQLALRAAHSAERWQGLVSLKLWEGVGVPDFEPEAALEVELGRLTAYAAGRYEYWGDEGFHSASGFGSVTVRLPLGLRLLAELEEGDRGIFALQPRRRLSITRWMAGAELRLWDWRLGGRGGTSRTDPSPAVGAPFDTIVALPGGTVEVVEGWVSGPLLRPFGGVLELGGRYQRRNAAPVLYWPQDEWRVEGIYRLLALRDQLEIWITALVGLRGPMFVVDESVGPGAVASSGDLTWFRGEGVVRIKDLHIYYNYESFNAVGTLRDVPGMFFPRARIHFGVKWEFWN